MNIVIINDNTTIETFENLLEGLEAKTTMVMLVGKMTNFPDSWSDKIKKLQSKGWLFITKAILVEENEEKSFQESEIAVFRAIMLGLPVNFLVSSKIAADIASSIGGYMAINAIYKLYDILITKVIMNGNEITALIHLEDVISQAAKLCLSDPIGLIEDTLSL